MVVGIAEVGPDAVSTDSGARSNGRALNTAVLAAALLGAVLRGWDLGGHDLTFDEAFTGAASQRDPVDLLRYLREADAHPPLDYLLRSPFAGAGSELLLRLPSLIWSLGTLTVLYGWMRAKGHLGAFAVIVASMLPFLVLHGREARMYSLTAFLGVVVACCADRWLARPGRVLALGIAAGTLLAALTHSTALVPLACLMILPGLRRDSQAWFLRWCLAAAAVVWAVAWGPAFRDQLEGTAAGWIPFATGAWVETVSAALVSPARVFMHLSAALLALGGILLLVRRRRLALVAAATFWLPFALLVALGLHFHVLLPRSFAFGIWVPVVSIAAVLDELRRRLSAPGVVLGCGLVAMLLVPPAIEHVRVPRERHIALDELRARFRPGDRISINPAWFAPVIEWEFAVKDGLRILGPDESDRFVIVDASHEPSGRTHLLDHARLTDPATSSAQSSECALRMDTASWILRCEQDAP